MSKSKFEVLESNVLKWAEDRNILNPENVIKQFDKTIEEYQETRDALVKWLSLIEIDYNNDNFDLTDEIEEAYEQLKDGMGDTIVTQIISTHLFGSNIVDCLEQAYEEIKNRTGRTIGGKFIKDE